MPTLNFFNNNNNNNKKAMKDEIGPFCFEGCVSMMTFVKLNCMTLNLNDDFQERMNPPSEGL